jgi:hypothetical protein
MKLIRKGEWSGKPAVLLESLGDTWRGETWMGWLDEDEASVEKVDV